MLVGPRVASVDIPAPEVLATPVDGLVLTRQDFPDGSIYEIEAPRGATFEDIMGLMTRFPVGSQLMAVHNPWDVDSFTDDALYVTAWAPGRCV